MEAEQLNAIEKLLSIVFTPGEVSQIKVGLTMVGLIWVLVEWRTKKRFQALEDVVTVIKAGYAKLDASFTKISEGFDELKETVKELINSVTRVENSDSSSTKLLTERQDRISNRQQNIENYLHRQSSRLLITETLLGVVPKPDSITVTTTKEEKKP